MSTVATLSWINAPLDGRKSSDHSSISFRARSQFGSTHQHSWLLSDKDKNLSKVRVAADYSDSLPDSTNYARDRGYHPLEEVKERTRNKDVALTDAEVARTLVEANNKALLVFPGRVHCEPHDEFSWDEFSYVVDDYGDIFFEILDNENMLEEKSANNPVAVLLGVNCPILGNAVMHKFREIDPEAQLDIVLEDDYSESEVDSDVNDNLLELGTPETMHHIHPIYFAKCMTKAVHANHIKKMDSPSNILSIIGYLRPAFMEEESYLRSLFNSDNDSDVYFSDWSDESIKGSEQIARPYGISGDGKVVQINFRDEGGPVNSRIYKLEIMKMELTSIYGSKFMVDVQDFQDAEPDILARCSKAVITRISEYGMQCTTALRSLCRKKKGLTVEGAKLIGVDSLGMDVRVLCGLEAQTVRFPFSSRAMSESAAEKKIKRMLFPRYHRKNSKSQVDGVREV